MRGWWQCPSGLGSDPRWCALSLAARGLLATLADAADGTGEVSIGRVPLATVLRGMAPGETSEVREALWTELTDAGFVDFDGPAILVTLPGGAPAGRRESPTGDDDAEPVEVAGEPQAGAQGARDALAPLRAAFSRRGLKTAETKLAWLATEEGAATVARLEVDPAAARAMAERTGRNPGRFGDGRTHGRTRSAVTAERRPNDGRTRTTVTAERRPNAPPPPHTPPPERKRRRKRDLASARPPPKTAERRSNAYDRDGVEDALVGASGGRVDLLSAPAHVQRDLHRVLSEMRVTPALARVMGELARDPAAVWKRATPVRRVTPQFLLGWVENSGERDARALSELVSAAREKVAARAEAARATPAPASAPKERYLTPEELKQWRLEPLLAAKRAEAAQA